MTNHRDTLATKLAKVADKKQQSIFWNIIEIGRIFFGLQAEGLMPSARYAGLHWGNRTVSMT